MCKCYKNISIQYKNIEDYFTFGSNCIKLIKSCDVMNINKNIFFNIYTIVWNERLKRTVSMLKYIMDISYIRLNWSVGSFYQVSLLQ